MRPRLASIALAALTLWSFGTGGAARAQDEEDARRHGIFIDTVEVSLVTVEVFASADGEPVTDLTAADFEVLDDGEPVEIRHFEHRADRPPPTSEAPAEETAADPEAETDREPATVIILVDQLFVSPSSRRQVFDAAARQIEALIAGGARIMVVGKTREISVEQGVTSNPALVRLALDRLAQGAPSGYGTEIATTVELWDLTPDAVESRQSGPGQPEPSLQTSELDAQSAFQDANALSRRIHDDVRSSLATLGRFLDSLAGLPGRKALVYVADQLPVQPGAPLWRLWWERFGFEHGSKFGVTVDGPRELDLSEPLEALISDANASRVAFYPIGATSNTDFSGAASRGVSTVARPAAPTTGASAGDGLAWLSQRSGGRRSPLTGDFEGLFDGLALDLVSYYSLGYVSPHAGDGEVHRVEVRVNRPGVRLRYPTEYRDKSADQRTTDRTLSTLTLGLEDNPLGVRVTVGKPKKQGARFAVPLEIQVPMANLVLLPDATVHRGKLSVQLMARDFKGSFSDPVVVRLPFEVRNADVAWALSQTVDYETEMVLERGRHLVAIGVHDDLGFSDSTLGVEVDVGSAQ